MIYGFHLSAQGAQAQASRLEVIANNLANAGTTAFKKAMAVFQDNRTYDRETGRPDEAPGNLNASTGGLTLADVVTDYSQGPLKETGGNLDVAIAGRGFLQVTDGQNQRFLTRNGNLGINAAGELVLLGSGHRVLSAEGESIKLTSGGGPVQINQDGTISQGGATVGRIGLYEPASTAQLQKAGDSLYSPTGPVRAADGTVRVKQGFLEGSGTNSVTEMLAMIQASRGFETNVNMIRHQDETMARLLQSLTRR
jgi:flagellar basal body rod protein FlgG